MLFENFFEDSRGNERSAGVMETSVNDLIKAINDSPSSNGSERHLVWTEKTGVMEMFFGSHTAIHMVFETSEERAQFVSRFPNVRLFNF